MRLPASMERLFSNYSIESLDLHRHRDLIIRTVLAHGTWDEIKWLFEHYGEIVVGDVFRRDYHGLRTLPKPTLRLWETRFIDHTEHESDLWDRWRCRRIPGGDSQQGSDVK